MRSRLVPFLTIILAMLLDTAVLPVFYHGIYTVPVTLAVVMCIGLLRGRLNGLFLGMIAGLLIDITTGYLGVMTVVMMVYGLLYGWIINEEGGRPVPIAWFYLRRGVTAFLLCMLGEIVFVAYRYYLTAFFELYYLRPMVIRSLICAVMTMLLCPALSRLFNGKRGRAYAYRSNNREVKYY